MHINNFISQSLFFVFVSLNSLALQAQEFSPRAQEILRQSVENENIPSLRYLNVSIYSSSPTISGSDDLFSDVDISSKLSLGFKLGYTYTEESITARAELSYRDVNFNKNTKSGTAIENNSKIHDIGLSYFIAHQTWEKVKLVVGIKYQSLYFFQSKVGQSYLEIKSEFEGIPSIGAEWMAWKRETYNVAPYALLGISLPTADVKNGLSAQFGFKFNAAYVANYSIIGDLSYSQTQNRTTVTQFTTDSKQSRSDLNLQLGMQKEF
jgi:hypothetical protein